MKHTSSPDESTSREKATSDRQHTDTLVPPAGRVLSAGFPSHLKAKMCFTVNGVTYVDIDNGVPCTSLWAHLQWTCV